LLQFVRNIPIFLFLVNFATICEKHFYSVSYSPQRKGGAAMIPYHSNPPISGTYKSERGINSSERDHESLCMAATFEPSIIAPSPLPFLGEMRKKKRENERGRGRRKGRSRS
jgi:hypothetical protein